MSCNANGLSPDLYAAVRRDFVGDAGVPGSAALLAFTNSVQLGEGNIDRARAELADEIGDDATTEAAAIVNGLVRVADGTGIALDGGIFAASADVRADLGIDDYTGAANSAGVEAGPLPSG